MPCFHLLTWASFVKGFHCDKKAFARLADHIRLRHAHILERDADGRRGTLTHIYFLKTQDFNRVQL